LAHFDPVAFSVTLTPLTGRMTGAWFAAIGVSLVIGFLVVFQSMYTAVLERTREIGILKALGASPGYVLNILLREAVVLAIVGAAVGILMTYGARALMRVFVPTMTQAIVPDWWPWAVLIAVAPAFSRMKYSWLIRFLSGAACASRKMSAMIRVS
jgi:ABC-type antimicrobial peptide transport system permease subunit